MEQYSKNSIEIDCDDDPYSINPGYDNILVEGSVDKIQESFIESSFYLNNETIDQGRLMRGRIGLITMHDNMRPPEISFNDNQISFVDGRHRFTNLRKLGATVIPVIIERQYESQLRRHGYIGNIIGEVVVSINCQQIRKIEYNKAIATYNNAKYEWDMLKERKKEIIYTKTGKYHVDLDIQPNFFQNENIYLYENDNIHPDLLYEINWYLSDTNRIKNEIDEMLKVSSYIGW